MEVKGWGDGVKRVGVMEDGGVKGMGWWGQGVGWWGFRDGSSLDWELKGWVVGLLLPTPHSTTHTPLLPSPLLLDPTTLDGILLIQKK